MAVTEISELPERAEVLIIGAGVSGLYCAYRLLTEAEATGTPIDVVVIPRLNRIGGRLDTDLVQIRNSSGEVETVRDEEGGMRFNFGMHQLMALNHSLHICCEIVPFPMGPTKSGFGLHYSLRDNQFPKGDAAKWSQIYNLSEHEQGKTPAELLAEISGTILAANAGVLEWPKPPVAPTPEDWQTLRLKFKWKDKALNEWQLWGLIHDLGYSEECIVMLSHSLGFEGPFLSLASAGEAFQILEDFPQPNFYTFKKDFSTLPNALCERIVDLGGRVFVGVNVEELESEANCWSLGLTVAPDGRSSSRFVQGGRATSVSAEKVILAVASNALANIYTASTALRDASNAEQLWADIQSVVNMRLLKINLYFAESWWEDPANVNPPVQYGPSFTDLPINSIYPFYSLDGATDARNPAALTIYCDFNNTNFWQGLQNLKPDFDSPLQREHSESPHVIFPASVAVVDEALKQIKQLFDVAEIPDPVMTSFRLWGGESDFGYAYHQWAINADDAAVMERLAEPAGNLYVCNEAYSDDQGWVNGALRSADRALRKGFGLDALPTDDDHMCREPESSTSTTNSNY